jgi:signal transduction histidine kinase
VRSSLPRLTLFFLALLLALRVASAAEPLDSIARIRALAPEEAARNLPVAIEAAVTFHSPGSSAVTAHDGNEGIYLTLPAGMRTHLGPGTRLRIEGVTQPGGFLPIIQAERATVLGVGPLPEPRRIDASTLFSPSLDCQWVQVPGIITGVEADSGIVLVAEISGWTVKLIVSPDVRAQERIAQIMQRPVIIRGVVGSVFNAERQLTGRHFFVGSFDQIVPAESVTPDGEPRLRAMNELLRSDATSRTRVRVRGVVTHATSNSFYLRGEGGSVQVRAASTSGLAPGTRVEAEGFAAVAPFRPILRATHFTALDRVAAPLAEPLDLTGKIIARQQAELVTLDADLLAHRDGPNEDTVLQCRAGNWFFEALLPGRSAESRDLSANDRVRLTGICEVTSTGALPFSGTVDGFRLHLRAAGDIAILSRAPWWTLRRLFWALGVVGAVALVALAWAALLRRRVANQTKIIGVQIERAAVKDERQRIARELHDTIEQELAGVSVQLRNARQRLAHAPAQAGTSLELAEKMLRHCRDEARTSIRDLRSVALEQRGLRGALEEFLAPLAAECGALFSIEVHGQARGLPGPVEIHLLRIAQEAVANAARHAAPRGIWVRLEYGRDCVVLEVRDDGRGFDPAAPAPRGHFGILGIQERTNKMQAVLAIESAPGSGSTIRVVVPAEVAGRGDGQLL